MKNLEQYKLLSVVLILAYVLSACSGAPAGVGGQSTQNEQSQEVVFSGTVEAIGAGQWTVSGQTIFLSGTTSLDADIQVGDNVKVEAVVDQAGVVTAMRIESASADDAANANSNDDNTNAANSNDGNANDGQDDNSNADDSNANANENGNDAPLGTEQEVFGTIQAITKESITINGVTYQIASFTEFKDLIAVGDSVKVHVIVNADGTLTIREIEKSDSSGEAENSNSNGSDDNSNADDSNDNGSGGNNNGADENGEDGSSDSGGEDDNDSNSGSNDNS